LLLNVRTQLVALASIPVLIGACWVQGGNDWVFSNAGGVWEYPLLLIVICAVVALHAQRAQTLSP
jgi:putative oxidoreductase